jgi:hypothetical protein
VCGIAAIVEAARVGGKLETSNLTTLLVFKCIFSVFYIKVVAL